MNKKLLKVGGYTLSLILLFYTISLFFKGSNYTYIPILISTVIFIACLLSDKFKRLSLLQKTFKTIGYIFSLGYIALSILFVGLCFNITGYKEGVKAHNYDTRIEIYSDYIPGNNKRSKLDDMEIQNKNVLLSTLSFTQALIGSEYKDEKKDIDTFTYGRQIMGGYEKETYEDVPYMIPYLVNDSDSAVIIIPGGGYGYKSLDGGNEEGYDIAKTLNDAGINTFVLWYRSNPYRRPIPQLDVQRSVRYLRYHAKEFNLNPDKISMIGFSAGGNQVGSYINLVQGKDLFPSDYTKDEIDDVDDKVSSAAMIYPAVSYRYNMSMLFASFDASDVRDDIKREALLDETDLILNFDSSDINQFVSYGTADIMVNMDETLRYINKAKELDTKIRVNVAYDGNHGYDQSYYMNDYLEWIKDHFN